MLYNCCGCARIGSFIRKKISNGIRLEIDHLYKYGVYRTRTARINGSRLRPRQQSATFSHRIQKFPRPHVTVFKSKLPVHTYPSSIRIHSRTQDSSGNISNISMRRKAREICIVLCLVLILDLISRIMAESARKSKKNAKSEIDPFIWMDKGESLGKSSPS